MMEQYYKTEQCPIQPVNRLCKRQHPLQSNAEGYSSGLVKSENPLSSFFANRASNFVLQNFSTYVEYIWLTSLDAM